LRVKNLSIINILCSIFQVQNGVSFSP
jgi:hypothetical protein